MPATITLFDELGTYATADGDWTRVSDDGPAAPLTYNASIDFTGTDPGDYTYSYEVTDDYGNPDVKTVTVSWMGDAQDRANDECATARRITGTSIFPLDLEFTDSTAAQCELAIAAPTESELDEPDEWIYGPYSGDLWYDFITPSTSSGYSVYITMYSFEVTMPAVQVFADAYLAADCTTMTEVYASAGNHKDTSAEVVVPANTQMHVRLRVATKLANAGQFFVQLLSSTTSGEVAVPVPTVGAYQAYHDVAGTGTLVWTMNNGTLPNNLYLNLDVFQNGKLLEYKEDGSGEFTVIRGSGPNESTIQITAAFPDMYYVVKVR